MARPATNPNDAGGQAAVETILLTFVLIVFVSAALQLHLMNRSIYRSLSMADAIAFTRAFERNRCQGHVPACEYSQNPGAEGLGGVNTELVWNSWELPEIAVPVLGPFARRMNAYWVAPGELLLGNVSPGQLQSGVTMGYRWKQTRVGAGTYKSPIAGLLWLQRVEWNYVLPFFVGYLPIGDPGGLAGALGNFGFLFPALQ